MKLYSHANMWDPAQKLATPHLINRKTDPKERNPADPRYSWTVRRLGWILAAFEHSVARDPLIPTGAPLDYVPTRKM